MMIRAIIVEFCARLAIRATIEQEKITKNDPYWNDISDCVDHER